MSLFWVSILVSNSGTSPCRSMSLNPLKLQGKMSIGITRYKPMKSPSLALITRRPLVQIQPPQFTQAQGLSEIPEALFSCPLRDAHFPSTGTRGLTFHICSTYSRIDLSEENHPHAGHVENRLGDPSFSVFIDPACVLLALDIWLIVGEDEVLVTVQKLIDQGLKEIGITARRKSRNRSDRSPL